MLNEKGKPSNKTMSSLTGVAALKLFVETHDGEYTKAKIETFLKEHAANRSVAGLGTLILNATTNVKRKARSEWGGSSYQEKGYNLLFRVPETGLYRRYVAGIDPAPVTP